MSHSEDLVFSANTTMIREMQQNALDLFEKITTEQDKYRLELESQREELVRRAKELEKREAQNREMEKRLVEMLELEKKLAAKQAVELEIKGGIERVLQAMQPTRKDVDTDINKKMERIQHDLKEKEKKLKDMEKQHQALIVKESKSSDENLEAFKEFIEAMTVVSDFATIGIKYMGRLEPGQFLSASMRKYSNRQEATKEAFKLFLLWERRLRNPKWHPFKIITTEGITEEVIDEDEILKNLRKEFGEELFTSVVTSLLERKVCNPAGGCRNVTPELWNFKEGRKARLQEGVAFILNQWYQCKRQKN